MTKKLPTISVFCQKCQLKKPHVMIVANTEDDRPTVACKVCQTEQVVKNLVIRKKSAKRLTTLPPGKKWAAAMDLSEKTLLRQAKDYSFTREFLVGDIIAHPSFGKGVVESIFDATKMNVLFEKEAKVLIHNQK